MEKARDLLVKIYGEDITDIIDDINNTSDYSDGMIMDAEAKISFHRGFTDDRVFDYTYMDLFVNTILMDNIVDERNKGLFKIDYCIYSFYSKVFNRDFIYSEKEMDIDNEYDTYKYNAYQTNQTIFTEEFLNKLEKENVKFAINRKDTKDEEYDAVFTKDGKQYVFDLYELPVKLYEEKNISIIREDIH